MDGPCKEWFYLCLALLGAFTLLFMMLLGYNLTLGNRTAKLEKKVEKSEKEIQEVERVNGKEKRDIRELQNKVEKLEQKYQNHA